MKPPDRERSLSAWHALAGSLAGGSRWTDGESRAGEGVPAAVLVALRPDGARPAIVLTRRSEHLRDHPGQVSFPGGCLESQDATPEAGALRETYEEIGLAPEWVDVHGRMPPYRTGTGFVIQPVIATLKADADWVPRPQPGEVAEVFAYPLECLLDPRERGEVDVRVEGRLRRFPAFWHEERLIWGATAGILVQLADRIGAEIAGSGPIIAEGGARA